MKQDEDRWQLEAIRRGEQPDGEDETDPGFPARWGERGAGGARGLLNVEGVPRIDRTNPNFLVADLAVSAREIPKTSKEAETRDGPPVSAPARELDAGMSLSGIAPALAPDESGFRQRVKDDEDEAKRRSATNESIDELIDGLHVFEAPLPRKKSARRLREELEEEESRPRRVPAARLTLESPISEGFTTGPAQPAKPATRTGSLVPAGLSRGNKPLVGGVLLLVGLLVAAFFVARSTQKGAAERSADPAANRPPGVASETTPSGDRGAARVAATMAASETEKVPVLTPASAAAPVSGTASAPSDTGLTKAALAGPASPSASVSARARHGKAPRAGAAAEDGTELDTSRLDETTAREAGRKPAAHPSPAAPTAPSASPAPSAEDNLLTGH